MEFSLIPLLSLVLMSVHAAAGLKCYSCTGITYSSGSVTVKAAITSAGVPEDAACDNGEATVTSSTCVPATSGYVEKCVTVRGEGSGTYGSLDYAGTGTYRACQLVASGVADGCTSTTELGPFANIGLTSFTAERCYCSSENCNVYTGKDDNGQATLAPALIPCLASLVLAVFAVL